MGRIIVKRLGKFDLLRGYKILVGGKHAGTVRVGGQIELSYPAGVHEIEAKIDWCRASPLLVEVPQSGDVVVEVVNTHGWKGAAMGAEMSDPGHYLTLRQAGVTARPPGPWG